MDAHHVAPDTRLEGQGAAMRRWLTQLALNTPNIIFVKDLEGRYVAVNPSFERLLGRPKETVLGRTDDDLFPPEFARAFRADDLQVIANGRLMQFEERVGFVGGPRVSLTTKFPLYDEGGRMVATGGVLSDFTERKQAEDELLASERRYAALFEHMHDAVILVDDEGRYREVNPAALAMLARTREEALRLRIGEVTAGSRSSARDKFAELLATGRASGEITVQRPDGGTSEAEFRAVANVMPGLHMVVLRDITAQKRAEAELRSSEERFRLIFDSSPLPMLALDARTRRFPLVNDAAVQLYGYSREQFRNLSPADICVAEERMELEAQLGSLERGQRFALRMRHIAHDGRVLEVASYQHVTEIGGRMVVLVTVVDRTERNRVRGQRDEYRRRLEQATRRLLTLQQEERMALAGDLHDHVGQALSALGIRLTMLQTLLPDAPPRVQELLRQSAGMIEEAGHATRSVIAELRPEALREYGLGAALRNLAARSWTRLHFDIRIETPEPAPRVPEAVEAALLRICQEALANVAKHALAQHAVIRYRPRPRGAVLHIADDGRGFVPGAHGSATGWGLLLMQERAASIGARFRIRSRPGKGTGIIVRWRERRANPRADG